VKIWDIRAPKTPSHTLQTPGENINVAWAGDGQTIAVGNKDDLVTFFDLRNIPSAAPQQQKPPVLKTLKSSVEVNEIGWNMSSNQFFLTTGRGLYYLL
jgi:THO complex subunit 3